MIRPDEFRVTKNRFKVTITNIKDFKVSKEVSEATAQSLSDQGYSIKQIPYENANF